VRIAWISLRRQADDAAKTRRHIMLWTNQHSRFRLIAARRHNYMPGAPSERDHGSDTSSMFLPHLRTHSAVSILTYLHTSHVPYTHIQRIKTPTLYAHIPRFCSDAYACTHVARHTWVIPHGVPGLLRSSMPSKRARMFQYFDLRPLCLLGSLSSSKALSSSSCTGAGVRASRVCRRLCRRLTLI
jgi:hypothetical protein